MKSFKSACALSAITIILSACGGGGSSSSTNTGNSSAAPSANSLTGLKGTFVVACAGESFSDGSQKTMYSDQTTLVVTPSASGISASVSVHTLGYTGSTNCDASTLDTDVTVTGDITDKGTTQNYKTADGKTVTANVVTFSYNGLKLSKGNITGSIPLPGTKTNVAYYFDGKNLYGSKGNRTLPDGLGDSLTTRPAVKQ